MAQNISSGMKSARQKNENEFRIFRFLLRCHNERHYILHCSSVFWIIVLFLLGCSHTQTWQAASCTATPKFGSNWTVPNLGIEFIWNDYLDIWVGKFEVTNQEYHRFRSNHRDELLSNEFPTGADWSWSDLAKPNHPVVWVSYNEADRKSVV